MCSISPAARAAGVSARARRPERRAAALLFAACRAMPRRGSAPRAVSLLGSQRSAHRAAGACFRGAEGAQRNRVGQLTLLQPATLRRAPRMMTLVVPSPTSSSCVRASSIMLCAQQRGRQRQRSEHAHRRRAEAVPLRRGETRRSRAGLRCRRWSARCLRGRRRQRRAGARQRRNASEPPRTALVARRALCRATKRRTAGGVEQHLEHRPRAQRGADDIRHGLRVQRSGALRTRQPCAPDTRADTRACSRRALAAAMLPVCALRPVSRFMFWSAAARERAVSQPATRSSLRGARTQHHDGLPAHGHFGRRRAARCGSFQAPPLAKAEENATGWKPPRLRATWHAPGTCSPPSGASGGRSSTAAAWLRGAAHAARFPAAQAASAHRASSVSASAAAASLRRGSGSARAGASPQLPCPPRCRWLTWPAETAARLCHRLL